MFIYLPTFPLIPLSLLLFSMYQECFHCLFITHRHTCTLHHCIFSGHRTLFKLDRWHSLAHYINSRLCLHRGLSGLVVGGRIWLKWQNDRKWEKKREIKKRQVGYCWEKVWDIWVKRTVWGWEGWDVVWAEVGVGGDHPHHMFHGVLWCGWLWTKHKQLTQPYALPDALICTATSPTCPYTHTYTHNLRSRLISEQFIHTKVSGRYLFCRSSVYDGMSEW